MGMAVVSLPLQAQVRALHSPVEVPFLLAGNFGEPRPNHFHCGIDVKTQGVENKRVLAVADGYVSRMTSGFFGFGNALYITHPDGYISVYCHLNDFAPGLQRLLRQRQYEEETERVDVEVFPGVYPVKAGDWIAYSGNTGSSTAPHLHLELHRASDEALVDPLPFFRHLLKDGMKPVAHGLKVYPRLGEGMVNGGGKSVIFPVSGSGIKGSIRAWGKIGMAIWADDYMDGTYNKFGIRRMVLRVDGREVFRSEMDEYMSADNPMVNSWGDYTHYRKTGHWYLKGFVEPGNKLSVLRTDENAGWVDICEERDYAFEYVLEDLFGNVQVYRFKVRGERNDALMSALMAQEAERRSSGTFLRYDRPHVIQQPGMELRIPKGALATDEVLHIQVKGKEDGVSNLYTLHDEQVPLLQRATLMLTPRVPVSHPEKCYIESKKGYVGGEYEDGWYSARIRDLGETYALAIDTIPPQCRLQTALKGGRPKMIRYAVTDKGSGVKSFKAYVDGCFVLFTSSRGVWTCKLGETPLKPENKKRSLLVKVTDRCGNETVDEQEFIY